MVKFLGPFPNVIIKNGLDCGGKLVFHSVLYKEWLLRSRLYGSAMGTVAVPALIVLLQWLEWPAVQFRLNLTSAQSNLDVIPFPFDADGPSM